MYQCKYQFWDNQHFPGFCMSLSQLYDRSRAYCLENNMYNKLDLANLDSIFPLIEFYYVSLIKLGYVNKLNYSNILRQLNTINLIKIIGRNGENFRGLTKNHSISINPYCRGLGEFSKEDSLKLALFHELGHIISDGWESEMVRFVNKLYQTPSVRDYLRSFGFHDKNDLINGFILLEDVLVEEAAEAVFYRNMNLTRPYCVKWRNDNTLPGFEYKSNFLLYSEFQELACDFFRCLSFMGNSEFTMNDIIKKACKFSFKEDFIQKIEAELNSDLQKKLDFSLMLACLGKVKDNKYHQFGMGNEVFKNNLNSYCKIFKSLAKNYRVTDTSNKIKSKLYY